MITTIDSVPDLSNFRDQTILQFNVSWLMSDQITALIGKLISIDGVAGIWQIKKCETRLPGFTTVTLYGYAPSNEKTQQSK